MTANTPTPKLEVIKCASIRRMTTGGNYINLTADVVLADEADAAIAKLTAERDALKENISVWHSYVREGLGISGEDLPFRFDYYAQEIATVITANKLISERVAVLDAMLRELKAETGHDDGLIAIRHLILRATQAEDYITARSGEKEE